MDVLEAWAAKRGLQVEKHDHWGAEATHVLLVDSGADVYEFYVSCHRDGARLAPGEVAVGVSLVKRGSKRHRALHRERMQHTHTVTTTEMQVQQALDECLAVVEQWAAEAGHAVQAAGAREP
jgi:hypothetical protein